MGGAKSKFEQTDWVRADGCLSKVEQTIDGSPPTSAYGIYYLTKAKLNQREFEVTDLEKNLLYTTKCVPGTLCWFDVYGKGLDDCLLRVQVDLSRRYWVIYRMGIPAFAGQLADREATEKLANDRREAGEDLTATPFLFRKCCIAVSWSRYMAVAMQYGAPEGVDLLRMSSSSGIPDESETDFFNHAAKITARMRERGSDSSLLAQAEEEEDEVEKEEGDKVEEEENKISSDTTTQEQQEETPPVETEKRNENDNDYDKNDSKKAEPAKFFFDATKEYASSSHGSIRSNTTITTGSTRSMTTNDVSENKGDQSSPTPRRQKGRLTAWVQKQRQAIKDNKKKQLKTDPLEGIIHLDKPIMLCQEIYDKIIGNHQTSVLSRGRAIELLRQDLEQHMTDEDIIDGNDYPFLADQDGIFAQIEVLRKIEEEQKNADNSKDKDDALKLGSGNEEDPLKNDMAGEDDDEQLQMNGTLQQQEGEHQKEPQEDNNNHDETNGVGSLENTQQQQQQQQETETLPVANANSKEDEQTAENGGSEEEETLIGYWKWENTWKVHQMKMHVAQGSDLALHVVMAIIVNQVRYERNAIAMTV